MAEPRSGAQQARPAGEGSRRRGAQIPRAPPRQLPVISRRGTAEQSGAWQTLPACHSPIPALPTWPFRNPNPPARPPASPRDSPRTVQANHASAHAESSSPAAKVASFASLKRKLASEPAPLGRRARQSAAAYASRSCTIGHQAGKNARPKGKRAWPNDDRVRSWGEPGVWRWNRQCLLEGLVTPLREGGNREFCLNGGGTNGATSSLFRA